jgi:hypothetical protein
MRLAQHACSWEEKSMSFIASGKGMFWYFTKNPTAFLKEQSARAMFFGMLRVSLITSRNNLVGLGVIFCKHKRGLTIFIC